jgi:hypothetical protein
MGITIHFEGQLADDAAYKNLLETADRFASERGWPIEYFSVPSAKLSRVRNEQDWDYEGPTKGVQMRPHPSCEPLRLEFDQDLYIQEFCKTQFAPSETHEAIVELIDLLAPRFANLEVVDESDYFETRDRDRLNASRERFFEVFEQELAKNPRLRGPLRLPSGRIADLVEDA